MLGVAHIGFLLSLLLIVDYLIALGYVSEFSIPRLQRFISAFLNYPTNPDIPAGFWSHLTTTLYELGVACLIVIGIVLPLAFAIGIKRTVKEGVLPWLLAFFAIPPIILYPIIYLLLGIGPSSKIALGALLGSKYLFLYVVSAVYYIKWDLLKMGRLFTNSQVRLFWKVGLPSILPILVSAIQIGVSHTIVGVIVGEIIVSSTGLGFLVSWAETTIRVPELYAIIAIAIIFSLAFIISLNLLEWRIKGRWKTI
jgi:NitT/TauT family transport system permease protein/taurine transport system permease protein